MAFAMFLAVFAVKLRWDGCIACLIPINRAGGIMPWPEVAMIRRISFVLVVVLIISFAASSVEAKRAFEIADYYRTAFVGSPVMSPDGATVVFSVGRYELESGTSWSEIWAMAADGKNLRQLTRGRHHDSSPIFSPDGSTLAFLSSRDEDVSQIYFLPMSGGEARQLTSFPGGVSDLVWSPDGTHIAVTAEVYPECGADADCNRTIRQSVAEGPDLS